MACAKLQNMDQENHVSYLKNKDMIYGMLSKNYKLLSVNNEKNIGYKKNKKQVVLLQHDNIEYNCNFLNEYEKIVLNYLSQNDVEKYKEYCIYNNLKYSKSYVITSVISGPFSNNINNNISKSLKQEIKETINKFDKKITIKSYEELNDHNDINEKFINLIDEWNIFNDKKYGWQNHSGYDKNYFLNYFKTLRFNFYSNFFFNNNKLIGYSFVSKNPYILQSKYVYFYLIRKFINSFENSRNIGLYIDYKTIQRILNDTKLNEIYIHFGGSSGNVLNYKLKKFPTFSTEKYYSGTIIKNDTK